MRIGITDHLEGPADQPSRLIYNEVAELALRADASGGIDYFWFAEHHAHAHLGHLPQPLLLALHLAGRTRRLQLGTAVICLNLHHPLEVAEQVAVADTLSGGRLAPGFGSGSSPEEYALFGRPETGEAERHARFAEALRIVRQAWAGRVVQDERRRAFVDVPAHRPLPAAAPDLASRTWVAVNSEGAARVAGELGFHVLFSHLRTPAQYRQYLQAYRRAGGRGLIAANRPVYVGADDDQARRDAEPTVRTLWRRFQREGKIAADAAEPATIDDLCAHPLNFIVGGPESVARALLDLQREVPFDVANLEIRWAGLTHAQVCQSLERLASRVRPLLAPPPPGVAS